MLSRLIDSSGWSHEQWLAASLLVFICLSVAVFLHRMFKLTQLFRKNSYEPNLRPLRRRRYYNTQEELIGDPVDEHQSPKPISDKAHAEQETNNEA